MKQMDSMVVYFKKLKSLCVCFHMVILGYVGGTKALVLTEKHKGSLES